MKQLTELNAWKQLQKHAEDIRLMTSNEFNQNPELRKQKFSLEAHPICLDYSRQKIDQATVGHLVALAKEIGLQEKIAALIQGDKVNKSENKPALHTALRQMGNKPVWVDGCNVMDAVLHTREQIRLISEKIREQKWLGYTGKPIKNIVNIGIGGSDLGPRLCISALNTYCSSELNYHFISDVDPDSFHNVIHALDPQTILFIVSSKSFTTKETLLNARKAMALYDSEHNTNQHFIAVTANAAKANQFGINTVVPIWDWVGGRYSLCSAINLITAIAIGYEHFSELLAGAHSMDNHFLHTEFEKNMPVMMALLGVWNNNFMNIHHLLVLAYSQRLEQFIPYMQQLDMESNGKSIDMNGRVVPYATGPIVWGGLGNQAQHSYLQLLCQGTHKVTADFITLRSLDNHIINAMCDYKMQVLSEGVDFKNQPNGYIPGNIPVNHLSLNQCTPSSLGALVALYEHKIYVQSVLWNINPFDQPGVESAKLINHFSKIVS